MNQKVFGKVTTKKKRKNNNKKKKKTQEIGHNFLIDFLFFIPHENKSVYIYISEREKNGQTPELARDDWLESLLAEDMNVTVVVNHLTPTVTMGHVSLKKEKKNIQNTFIVTFCS